MTGRVTRVVKHVTHMEPMSLSYLHSEASATHGCRVLHETPVLPLKVAIHYAALARWANRTKQKVWEFRVRHDILFWEKAAKAIPLTRIVAPGRTKPQRYNPYEGQLEDQLTRPLLDMKEEGTRFLLVRSLPT